jgi:hypothetical protein
MDRCVAEEMAADTFVMCNVGLNDAGQPHQPEMESTRFHVCWFAFPQI